MPRNSAFIFDLDGTLVDNVYRHVLAWQAAFNAEGMQIPAWRIHRKIGMSGVLLVQELMRDTGAPADDARVERVHHGHSKFYQQNTAPPRPTPGAADLLKHLSGAGAPWAIATSGHADNAASSIASLGIDQARAIIVTGDQVQHAKPNPDLLIAAGARLGQTMDAIIVVGDSIWDMYAAKRAGALGVGLLSGGYARTKLQDAGAYRVFEEPADLLNHIDELVAAGA